MVKEDKLAWKTIGQLSSIDRISKAASLDRLSHAYLICGMDGIGKVTFARDIAKVANCLDMSTSSGPCGSCNQCIRIDSYNHTDVFIYDAKKDLDGVGRTSTMVTIDQLREDFLRQVHRKPYEGRTRIFIISSIESMRSEQSNILLKTLEEPPDDVVIILLARDASNLLSTIVSRCQVLNLEPVGELEILEYLAECELGSDVPIQEIARLSRGRPEWAYQAAINPEILRILEDKLNQFAGCLTDSLEQRFKLSRDLSAQFFRDRDGVYEFLDTAMTLTRDVLLSSSERTGEIVNISQKERIHEFSRMLSTADILNILKLIRITFGNLKKNVTPSLVLDNFMLKLPVATAIN